MAPPASQEVPTPPRLLPFLLRCPTLGTDAAKQIPGVWYMPLPGEPHPADANKPAAWYPRGNSPGKPVLTQLTHRVLVCSVRPFYRVPSSKHLQFSELSHPRSHLTLQRSLSPQQFLSCVPGSPSFLLRHLTRVGPETSTSHYHSPPQDEKPQGSIGDSLRQVCQT